MEIWRTQLATAQEVLAKAGVDAKAIRAIGITNQRETTMLWHRKTGRPIHHAIVWQDRRGEPMCARLREAGHDKTIQSRTGLLVDSYFSATKIAWLLENVPGARALADKGELAFGTVDSWLLWQLTGGALHATDVTNASRTMLFNVHENRWDAQLMTLFGVPDSLMPKVLPSSAHYGETAASLFGAPIAIGGVAGDQQAALFGQACFKAGMAKNTYGTGCFMLMHTGEQFQQSANGLVTTSAAQLTAKPEFAIEGSVFVGGAVVQWLRDGLHAIKASTEVQALAETVPDAGGVMMVPAFTGLGAPYWKPDARGMITGLTRGTTVAHIARAALESIAYQSAALLRAMGSEVKELRVDGGACVNDLLMQFQADLLGIPVIRPAVTETTALGAAYLAGLASGVWRSTSELSQLWAVERRFLPTLDAARSSELMARWEHAVRQAALA
jgi:glycerol kinase